MTERRDSPKPSVVSARRRLMSSPLLLKTRTHSLTYQTKTTTDNESSTRIWKVHRSINVCQGVSVLLIHRDSRVAQSINLALNNQLSTEPVPSALDRMWKMLNENISILNHLASQSWTNLITQEVRKVIDSYSSSLPSITENEHAPSVSS
jgi:hypothetical protein